MLLITQHTKGEAGETLRPQDQVLCKLGRVGEGEEGEHRGGEAPRPSGSPRTASLLSFLFTVKAHTLDTMPSPLHFDYTSDPMNR